MKGMVNCCAGVKSGLMRIKLKTKQGTVILKCCKLYEYKGKYHQP